jgi:flagellar assembly protein FliH
MSSLSSATKAPRARVLRGLTAPSVRLGVMAEIPSDAPLAADAAADADAGYQAGYAEGLAAGRAAAGAEARAAGARLERATSAVVAAAAGLARRQALELAGLEDTIATAAFELAAAVVGRELQLSVSPGADALARALALAPSGVAAVARLHPDDAASVSAPDFVRVLSDPAVEPGGCVLEAGDCRIDAQLGPALARARAALLDVTLAGVPA